MPRRLGGGRIRWDKHHNKWSVYFSNSEGREVFLGFSDSKAESRRMHATAARYSHREPPPVLRRPRRECRGNSGGRGTFVQHTSLSAAGLASVRTRERRQGGWVKGMRLRNPQMSAALHELSTTSYGDAPPMLSSLSPLLEKRDRVLPLLSPMYGD